MGQMLREVNAPYTVNADDEAIGRETIISRRNGEPVAAVVPYAEYRHWLAKKEPPHIPTPVFGATRSAALAEACNRFGDVPMCIQEVREKPRIYRIESPRLVRGSPSPPPPSVIWEGDTESTPPSDSSGK